MVTVREHLARCSLCREHLRVLAEVWKPQYAMERLEPPAFLWTKLQARIAGYERRQRVLFNTGVRLAPMVRPAFYVVLFIVVLIAGNRFGTVPGSVASRNVEQIAKEEAAQLFYLEALEPIPPESIGKILILTAD